MKIFYDCNNCNQVVNCQSVISFSLNFMIIFKSGIMSITCMIYQGNIMLSCSKIAVQLNITCVALFCFLLLCILSQKGSAQAALHDSRVNSSIVDEELRNKIEENALLHKQVKFVFLRRC